MEVLHSRKLSFALLTAALICSLSLDGNPACAVENAATPIANEPNAMERTTAALESETKKSARPIKDKWAVVIGIDRFQDKRIPTLRFSAKDARDFAKFLVEKANFKPDHVLLLLNENATRNNIYSALGDTWLPRLVLEDDLVLIYASTHGSPKELDVGGDNFLIAYDTAQDQLFTSGIKLQDLAPTVKQRTQCDRVVLILDACNSGAAEAGGKGLFRTTNFDVSSLAGTGQIVISSSSAEQRSWESKRYENGVFTRNLMKVLEDKEKKANLIEAFDKLKDSVQAEVKFDRKAFQTPVLHSKWEGEDLILTAKPAAPRDLGPEAVNKFSYESVLKNDIGGSTAPVEAIMSTRPTTEQVKTVSSPVPEIKLTPVSQIESTTSRSAGDLPSYGVVPRNDSASEKVKDPTPEEMDMWMKFNSRWSSK